MVSSNKRALGSFQINRVLLVGRETRGRRRICGIYRKVKICYEAAGSSAAVVGRCLSLLIVACRCLSLLQRSLAQL